MCRYLITELPWNIGELTQLEFLEIKNNLLTELPPSLANCECLDYLNFTKNNITTVYENLRPIIEDGYSHYHDRERCIEYDFVLEYIELKPIMK